jgi:hypothetical protein
VNGSTKLIKLEDGTLIEVEVPPNQAKPIAGGAADKIDKTLDKTFDRIRPILVKACRPIAAAWKELDGEIEIQNAELQIGLNIEAEGNVYITKSKASANLTVKMTIKPKE